MIGDRVFLRLITDKNDIEDRLIGLLHIKEAVDYSGVVRRISIERLEFTDSDTDLYFEKLDTEFPEIPGLAIIKANSFLVASFQDPNEGEWVEIDEEDDVRPWSGAKKYPVIVRAAQRLLERVRRQEPIMVGPEDINEFRSTWRWSDGFDSPALSEIVPSLFCHTGVLPTSVPALPHAEKLLRVHLAPNTKERGWPTLTLDVAVQADGFPARTSYMLGLAQLGPNKRACPLAINEDGMVTLLASSRQKRRLFATNVMARRLTEGEDVAFWSVGYRKFVTYSVRSSICILP